MSIQCPNCKSKHIQSRDFGRKGAGIMGAAAGGACWISHALRGARFGFMVGSHFGPIGSSIGTIGGAIFAGLSGAAAGGVAGSKLGEKLDKRLFNNYQCQQCSHTFSKHKG